MFWAHKRTVSMRDSSFESPEQMLKLMVKQIFKILGSNVLFISTYDEIIRIKNIREIYYRIR